MQGRFNLRALRAASISTRQRPLRTANGRVTKQLLLALALCGVAQSTWAQDANEWIAKAHELNLANQDMWQRLLYMKDGKSLVKQNHYFLSKGPKIIPQIELEQTLLVFAQELANPPADKDQSAWCRFPARRRWLFEQLAIQAPESRMVCPELDAWQSGLQADHATLTFASDYMGNPSSMFGHSMLRIDSVEHNDRPLLSYAINYSATNSDEASIKYAVKGLTGGYPGGYALMPYYEKVKEYANFESRDLWEYELNLTPQETRRVVEHLWELKKVTFPYYFARGNCSYALLGLLDIARPELDLQSQFPFEVIPVRTVQVALEQGKLLKKSHYRPAAGTSLEYQSTKVPELASVAHQISQDVDNDDLLMGYTPAQQAHLLEMAYDDLYLRHVTHKEKDSALTQKQLRKLLLERSKINEPEQRITVPEPQVDPAHGHLNHMMGMGYARHDQTNGLTLDARFVYHQALDPLGGYRMGASIDVLHPTLWINRDQIKLQQFTLFEVKSLAVRNAFSQPNSWALGLDYLQQPNGQIDINTDVDQQATLKQVGVWRAHAARGITMGNPRSYLCFANAQASVQIGKKLNQGWRTGAGPQIGCLWYPNGAVINNGLQLQAQAQTTYWHNGPHWLSELKVAGQYQLRPNLGLRLENTSYYTQHKWNHQTGISLVRYF